VKDQTLGQLRLVVEMLAALAMHVEGERSSWADVFGVKLAAVRKAAEKAAHTKVTKVAKEEEKKAA
jgi:hypothetical protein